MGYLTVEDSEYLLGRGYTRELLAEEVVSSVSVGDNICSGVEFYLPSSGIAFVAKSMSGEIIGVQTACREKHEYRWHQARGKAYLPILYGSDSDCDRLYQIGEVVLVEGIFDRIAMRRFLPGHAVFARLSKGVSEMLAVFLCRYAKRVWLAFDNDKAGKDGDERARLKLSGIECYSLSFPTKDPGELYERYGVSRGGLIVRRQMEFVL